MSHRRIMSRESLKLIWMRAEEDVMKSCFYCKKCEKCDKFFKIKNEYDAKGFRSFNKDINCLKVMYGGRNKQFKVKPRN